MSQSFDKKSPSHGKVINPDDLPTYFDHHSAQTIFERFEFDTITANFDGTAALKLTPQQITDEAENSTLQEQRAEAANSNPQQNTPGHVGDLIDPNWGLVIDITIEMGGSLNNENDFLSIPLSAVRVINKHFESEYHFTTMTSPDDQSITTGYHIPEHLRPFLSSYIRATQQQEAGSDKVEEQTELMTKMVSLLEKMAKQSEQGILQQENVSDLERWIDQHQASIDTTSHPTGQPMVRLTLRHIHAERKARAKDGATDIPLVYLDEKTGKWASTSLQGLTEPHLFGLEQQKPAPVIGHLIEYDTVSHLQDYELRPPSRTGRMYGWGKEIMASWTVRYGALALAGFASFYALASSSITKNVINTIFPPSSTRPSDIDLPPASSFQKDRRSAEYEMRDTQETLPLDPIISPQETHMHSSPALESTTDSSSPAQTRESIEIHIEPSTSNHPLRSNSEAASSAEQQIAPGRLSKLNPLRKGEEELSYDNPAKRVKIL